MGSMTWEKMRRELWPVSPTVTVFFLGGFPQTGHLGRTSNSKLGA